MQDYGINIQRFQIVGDENKLRKVIESLSQQYGTVKEYVNKAHSCGRTWKKAMQSERFEGR